MQLMDEDTERPGTISEGAIKKALEEIQARIAKALESRAELERTIAGAREEERLLKRLLALKHHRESFEGNSEANPIGDLQLPEHPDGTDPGHPVIQAVVEELASAGRPLHISDLMRLLRERMVEVPGAGTQANLITYLRRDSRIVRPSRGMYGLAAWGLEDMPIVEKSRRIRKHVRSATASERKEE